jgi:hypothetical protein
MTKTSTPVQKIRFVLDRKQGEIVTWSLEALEAGT